MATIPESFRQALQHHRAGHLREAEKTFRQILQAQPDHPEALHYLGVIAHQVGRHDLAVNYIGKAITLNPNVAEYHNNIGQAYRAQGKLEEAVAHYRQALALKPDRAEVFSNLGSALKAQGKLEDAVASYRQALTLKPTYAEAYFNLGNVLQEQGNLEYAAAAYRQALALKPTYSDAYTNWGNALRGMGKLEEAVTQYRKALALKPDRVETHVNLGTALHEQGQGEEAIASFRRAIALRPTLVEAHNNLGNVLKEQGKIEGALECYRHAVALKPAYVTGLFNMGNLFREQGKLEEATEAYRQVLAIAPKDGVRILRATLVPVIADSKEQLLESRRCFAEQVADLSSQKLSLVDPVQEVGATNFYLAYHGLDDRDLQSSVAQLHERACPSLLYTAPHCLAWPHLRKEGKIRIGFISKFLKSHSIGKTTRGVLANLSRDQFSVRAVFVPPVVDDDISRFIREKADKVLVLPGNLQAARNRLAEEELDILFYQDIGMEPFTYFLAFSRLAPIQCVSFGHPVTSGIRNLDYYISTENFEPVDGDAHYSERLVRLKSPIAYYYKPDIPGLLKPRSRFGLADAEHIYICPQSLFKFHPDFDDILAGILRGDPRGRLVLVGGKVEHWAELLLERFKQMMPEVVDRVTLMPPQNGNDFINLIAIADVMLDTIHFCGFNTSLEAFAVGTPVVTLPGEFQRGRHTLAFYKEMGLLDCVADSPGRYVEIAVRLGTDRVYREAVKAKILAHHQVLYENADVIREFERFFVGAVEDARSEVVQKAGGVLPGKPDQPTAGHETVRGTVTRALTSSGALSEPAVGRAGRLVDDCRRQIMNTIPPVIPKERRLALIDFPDYPNCGDHAIWAGEKALLRFLGIAPVYECSMTSYDEEALRAELKDGVILMQGGGNFGDIYVYQKFRERVIASFPHNEIIIFPQSVKFKYQDQLDRSKAVFRKHGHVTIVARDADSFNFLERHFTCPRVLLCPDMAFMLGMLNRPVQPCVDILYLCRSDDESRYAKGTALGFDRSQCRRTINRLPPFPGTRYEIPLAVECIDNLEITDWHDVALGFPSRLDGAAFFDHMSAAMTDYAMKILSRGRVVVSDRLHAHILCLLLNIPHVLIENSYGKLGSFYKTWTSGSDITHWAENPRDAISVANTLVQGASKSK